MTRLWKKVAQSLRNGRLRLQLGKLSHVRSGHRNERFSEDEDDEEQFETCQNDHLMPYLRACSVCKQTVSHYQTFDLSSFDFTACCPLCGLEYTNLAPRRITLADPSVFVERQNNNIVNSHQHQHQHHHHHHHHHQRNRENGDDDEFEHHSITDSHNPPCRLPPICYPSNLRTHVDGYESPRRRYETQNSPSSSPINEIAPPLLPPIFEASTSKKIVSEQLNDTPIIESKKRRNSLPNRRNSAIFVYDETTKHALNRVVRYETRQEFLQELRKARKRDNYANIENFYTRTFNSLVELCSVFKIDSKEEQAEMEDAGLKMEFMYSVYDAIDELPTFIPKIIIKSIVNSFMDDRKLDDDKDRVRAVFILLQCPIFACQNSYVVLAHILRYCVRLPRSEQQHLVNWFKTYRYDTIFNGDSRIFPSLEANRLRVIVRQLLQFITVRQFSSGDKTLPTLDKSGWWIPAATKVLALINAANNDNRPPLLHYDELYNSALDHIDLMRDYYTWQNRHHPAQFAYCQYPFILSILAKRFILTKDSEQQMILNARKSLVAKMSRHQTPQIDIFFLNINVRRSCLVNDSLNEIMCKQHDLKKKLKVSFVGEPGLDMGGLTKEWFLLLVREIFDLNYGMFVYHARSQCYWFSVDNKEGNLREYNLIGVLMGLAVYNSNILDVHFPSVCYRKLLTPPVVPSNVSSQAHNLIGIIASPNLDDLNEIMPEVARGLKELLEYDGNVEEDMGMNFQISLEEFGEIKTFELKDRGSQTPVTNENRMEYVKAYLDWILNKAIYEQFKAFYLGFHSVCASNALIMLRGEEVEMLVCGSQNMDMAQLRKVTEYDGFDPREECIEHLWDILQTLPKELQKKFLLFTTGSDRIPVGGVSEMTFKISRSPHKTENLPEAHTCFNQLVLPRYENKATLREKLITAISNAEGFGLE